MIASTSTARRFIVMVLALFVFSSASFASVIHYAPPAKVAATLVYNEISESSGTDVIPLYGAPTVSGDTLLFNNMAFTAFADAGSTVADFTDGQLNLTLTAKPGQAITSFTITESGDWTLADSLLNPGIPAATKVTSPGIILTVLEIAGVPVSLPSAVGTMVFSPSGGDFFINLPPNVNEATGVWSGAGSVDVEALFGAEVTKIAVAYNNQLQAESGLGASAHIAKKQVAITPHTQPIPEPASLALAAMGLPLLLRRCRTS